MIRVENVYKSFGQHSVLNGVSFEVAAGETVCIIGPSGSGKSTMLRCINHLERIDSGRILVNGSLLAYREENGRLYELPAARVAVNRRALGMVFNQPVDNLLKTDEGFAALAGWHGEEKGLKTSRGEQSARGLGIQRANR